MPAIQLKDGHSCTHGHTDRMVTLATKWLAEYFSDGVARRPGELEDDFAGKWSLQLDPWKSTPFYPALAKLVDSGVIVYGIAEDGDFWYAIPGKLPDGITQEP